MTLTKKSFRHAAAHELASMLSEAHDYTLSLFECLATVQSERPNHLADAIDFNPPLWDLGHLAWFTEWVILRDAQQKTSLHGLRSSMLSKGDDWFASHRLSRDSDPIQHLPKAGQLITYKNEVLDRVLDKLSRTANTDDSLYPFRMALAHEDGYAEYWTTLLQTLGLRAPLAMERHVTPPWAQSEIRFPGGSLLMGSAPGDGFVFDTEKSAHIVYVPGFCMDTNLISNAQFAEFVEDNGYQRPQYWSVSGKQWLMQQERSAPLHWSRDGNWWRCARFGRAVSLAASEPVRHLSLYEAQAYCIWAERRLPTEAEWEYGAASGHAAFRWGDLWEWTCSPFEPYPGFIADPITVNRDPEPAFVSHQSVRGASFATPMRMRSVRYRNFLLPEHCNNFVGFRTCRL
ncbi:MAG: SUMF1/EgtB/PvdO family nonheme iron enzyme [Undibacterium sp.]|uniref:SUMF1/EgtB/PvdO family nonheme iron enzyme n=1 Tax=Undibacterium sp. TaxID=1914977 RepID=UPI00271F4E0E|nr:SUMF1/EgtB/PvdO family nonheme iron enzyme [Undibacterium sp.]MDO8653237.1 SUMF1/EgtB/PvdO family nonheme iron enzyme [Undibacterium sp.]